MQDLGRRIERSAMELYEPVNILPLQYFDASASRCKPEMGLVAAILEDALQCIAHNVSIKTGRRRRDFLDAYQWVLNDGRDWPFAFGNVCELLGLDQSAVRGFVRRLIDDDHHGSSHVGVRVQNRRAG